MCGAKLLWWDLEFIDFDFLDFGGKKNWGWDGIKGIDRRGYGNDIDGLKSKIKIGLWTFINQLAICAWVVLWRFSWLYLIYNSSTFYLKKSL